MDASHKSLPTLPPEAERYLKGAPPESRQFDFLLGEWRVAVTRFNGDGSVLMQHPATWSATAVNEGRMIIDDFKACLPTGQDISSIVTLRTYASASGRWEMTVLGALQPAMPAQFYGLCQDGEMQLEAVGKNPAGITIRNQIRFFGIEKHRFQWESRISQDDGVTWVLAVSMIATRIEA
jgi:hypothetical protein